MVSRAGAGGKLRLTVALRSRDAAQLARLAGAVSMPGSPLFHRYLTVSQFARRFGATAAQLAAVRSALRARGLTVGPASANDLTVAVTGNASEIHRIFEAATVARTATAGRVPAPTVPRSIAPYVQGILGLDDPAPSTAAQSPAASAASVSPGPQPCPDAQIGVLTADQVAAAYDFSTLYLAGDLGGGQSVAIATLLPYDPSDIAVYQRCYGTSASVTNVSVDGGPGSFTQNTVGETELDIEQVIGLAPAANILVYGAPSNAPFADILNAIVSADRAGVISDSIAYCETTDPVAELDAENTLLQEAAVQGQSFFSASGDTGSQGCLAGRPSDTALSVVDPASQPFATGVGGTTLDDGREYLWPQSGGGISSAWPMPSYQADAPRSLNVINSNSSAAPCAATTYCREVPDVSADANPGSGYSIYIGGVWGQTGGTSASAPLWAALTALADSSSACHGHQVGFANPALYRIAATGYGHDLTDITDDLPGEQSTNNSLDPNGLYPVGLGYDTATGLGSPIGSNLAAALCGAPAYTVTIANPGTRTTPTGHAVAVHLRAVDSGGAALIYGASGLPAGLTISRSTGVISGTPTTAGTSTVTVAVTDPYLNNSSTTFKWLTVASPLTVSHGSLSGIARRKPKLSFTLTVKRGARALDSIRIGPPAGLTFHSSRAAVTVVGSGRRPIILGTSVRHGALTLTFARPQRTARVTIAYPGLVASRALAGKARRHKLPTLSFALTATDTARTATAVTLELTS